MTQVGSGVSSRSHHGSDSALRPDGDRKRNDPTAVQLSGRHVRRMCLSVPVDVAVCLPTLPPGQLHRTRGGMQRRKTESRPHQTKVRTVLLQCALTLAAQCIVIGPVCGWQTGVVSLWLCLWVCYHDNSKFRVSIFTKLGL